MRYWTLVRVALVALALVVCQATWTLAGTTGGVSGVVKDNNGSPVAGATVTVSSPSQTAHNVTNATGFYSILDLSPDTYVVTVAKDGYDTATVYGVTVQADQTTSANVQVQKTVKILGRIVTTAQASVLNKSVTGDLYSVNAEAINSYQGSVGGSESLYSQTGIVGSLPGVVKLVGLGGGYQQGQGSLSLRGGAFDQIGYELDGIPLNRGFDFYNATPFVSNGLSSLEVYTGGEPADAGRAMSGYVNEVIRRGGFPGGGDLTVLFGTPALNNTLQADLYGGTPDRRFTYYVSTLAFYAGYNFGNGNDLDGYTFTVPANDPGCPANNFLNAGPNQLNCSVPNTLVAPISSGAWFPNGSPINPSTSVRDTVANVHYMIDHNGLQDDVQLLYNVGWTYNPFKYSGASIDPFIAGFTIGGIDILNVPNYPAGPIFWPTGFFYTGDATAPFDPAKLVTLTWPSALNSSGIVPQSYVDNQWTQHSIEKLSYTRALTPTSFIRLYGYGLYSLWSIDQATNGFLGGTFYQLHDNATGLTLNYQNQLNSQHLLRFDADYSKDVTLRYNYGNWLPFNQTASFIDHGLASIGNFDTAIQCFNGISAVPASSCSAGEPIVDIGAPYGYWSSTTPITWDGVIADQWKPSDKVLVDLGVRFDEFQFQLMPLQITGPNGLAEQVQNLDHQCLFGYAYAVSEPCHAFLAQVQGAIGNSPSVAAGAATWQDVSGTLSFSEFSPRFGITFTGSPNDVFRFSVGRYVQPPDSAFEEYRGAPQWGPYATVAILNRFYKGLGFTAVHNTKPEDSINYDASWEHDFSGGISAKLSPYYRTTRGQILNLPVSANSPSFVTGYNFGTARISGVEFLLRKAQTRSDIGWSATLSATYTNSKVRFEKGPNGQSFIDIVNGSIACNCGIAGYNAANGTHLPLEDPNAYYSPSFSLAAGDITPSWDVPWVVNLTGSYRWEKWEITPTFNFQSGNPYGDPFEFPDATGGSAIGPDPYTKQFDALGSLKGPSWLTMNLGVSRDVSKWLRASVLFTNVFTSVHNHGYAWEYPPGNQVITYGDNTFYNPNDSPFAESSVGGAYLGSGYWGYAPNTIMPIHQTIFSLSTKF